MVPENNVIADNVVAYTTNNYNVNANDDQLDPGISVPGSGSAARNEVANNCAITTLNLANDDPDMSGIENTSGTRYFYRTNNVVGNAQFFDLVSDDYRISTGTT